MEETNYYNATGIIEYNMLNDYMFRIILQENKIVLKGLICSLLRLTANQIKSVDITNPIQPGANINEKEFILDINILMNNDMIINLEMQMSNKGNWTDRALNYLCRNFTHIQRGEDYRTAKPVIHIGFLNYTLFPESPEFYATYQMKNLKTNSLFSSKLTVGVIDLNQTELATDEDKAYALDTWVALFKSKTWEELRMIANENPEFLEAGKSLYNYNNEDTIRFQCYAREDYRKEMNTIRKTFEELNTALVEKDAIIAEQDARIAELEALLAKKNNK